MHMASLCTVSEIWSNNVCGPNVVACVALECSEPAEVGLRLGPGPQGLVLCLRRAERGGLSADPQLAARISLERHTWNFGG